MDRILPVLKRNYDLEVRDIVWNMCMDKAAGIEVNEGNLENMFSTNLVYGFGGCNGKEELIRLAEAIGVAGITNPENDCIIIRVSIFIPFIDLT